MSRQSAGIITKGQNLATELRRHPVMDRLNEGSWDSAGQMIPLDIGGLLPQRNGYHHG